MTNGCGWADAVRFDSTRVLQLVGEYRLTLRADSFPYPDAAATGDLLLRAETDTLRRHYRYHVITGEWRPGRGRSVVGTLEFPLAELELAAGVDPRSSDPDAPGVYYDDHWQELRVGYRPFTLDGASTRLTPEVLSADGFGGRWDPDYGIGVVVVGRERRPAHVGGYFCAEHVPET